MNPCLITAITNIWPSSPGIGPPFHTSSIDSRMTKYHKNPRVEPRIKMTFHLWTQSKVGDPELRLMITVLIKIKFKFNYKANLIILTLGDLGYRSNSKINKLHLLVNLNVSKFITKEKFSHSRRRMNNCS